MARSTRTFDALVGPIGQSEANTSRHQDTLHTAQLAAVRRKGLSAHDRVAGEELVEPWQGDRGFGDRRLAEVERAAFIPGVRSMPVDQPEADVPEWRAAGRPITEAPAHA